MRLELVMPRLDGRPVPGKIEVVHIMPGQILSPGDKLFDFSVDLSESYGQECPPISYYRLVTREPAGVVGVLAEPGARCDPGRIIGHFVRGVAEIGLGEEEEEARPLRVITAAILAHDGMWSHRTAA
jgi:hypothetical protein